jgi:hypothetical protein
LELSYQPFREPASLICRLFPCQFSDLTRPDKMHNRVSILPVVEGDVQVTGDQKCEQLATLERKLSYFIHPENHRKDTREGLFQLYQTFQRSDSNVPLIVIILSAGLAVFVARQKFSDIIGISAGVIAVAGGFLLALLLIDLLRVKVLQSRMTAPSSSDREKGLTHIRKVPAIIEDITVIFIALSCALCLYRSSVTGRACGNETRDVPSASCIPSLSSELLILCMGIVPAMQHVTKSAGRISLALS